MTLPTLGGAMTALSVATDFAMAQPALQAAGHIARLMLSAERDMARIFTGHCEVGRRLATRIGFEPELVTSLGQLYERWDGKGLPNRLRGDAVARPRVCAGDGRRLCAPRRCAAARGAGTGHR